MDASTAASAYGLRTAHERIAAMPEAHQGMRSLVAESWRRCAASGVSLHGDRLPPLRTTPEELAAYRRAHPLAAVLPLFRELLGAGAADDTHVFAVGDAGGMLPWIEGDSATLPPDHAVRVPEHIPGTLELGGKSPNNFFNDAAAKDDDFLNKAVEGPVLHAFNKGEVCTCPSHALVQEGMPGGFSLAAGDGLHLVTRVTQPRHKAS
jgi:hypothetical protein